MLKVLKAEMGIAERYGAKFNMSKMVLYVVGGEGFNGDVSEFELLGIKIDRTMNISFMRAPVCGSQEFLQQFWKDKMVEIKKVFEGGQGHQGHQGQARRVVPVTELSKRMQGNVLL